MDFDFKFGFITVHTVIILGSEWSEVSIGFIMMFFSA